jgi:glutaminyl-tRNA synthetase
VPQPGSDKAGPDWKTFLNADSLKNLAGCRLEPSLANAMPGDSFQFERQGYFLADPVDSKPGAPVFSRVVTLRDSWAKGK